MNTLETKNHSDLILIAKLLLGYEGNVYTGFINTRDRIQKMMIGELSLDVMTAYYAVTDEDQPRVAIFDDKIHLIGIYPYSRSKYTEGRHQHDGIN